MQTSASKTLITLPVLSYSSAAPSFLQTRRTFPLILLPVAVNHVGSLLHFVPFHLLNVRLVPDGPMGVAPSYISLVYPGAAMGSG